MDTLWLCNWSRCGKNVLYFHAYSLAFTCPPSSFIRGCNSLKRSYPWWKKVRWAYMKDSICKEASRLFSMTKKESLKISTNIRINKIYLPILRFLIFSWTVARWSEMSKHLFLAIIKSSKKNKNWKTLRESRPLPRSVYRQILKLLGFDLWKIKS